MQRTHVPGLAEANSGTGGRLADVVSLAFHVPQPLVSSWQALEIETRTRVGAFLTAPACRRGYQLVDEAPEAFAEDLAHGGACLRTAFSSLFRAVRRVELVGPSTFVSVGSRAVHDGVFFGIVQPTGRTVSFHEVHELTLGPDGSLQDRVRLDLRRIVRQLVRS
jgi:hypothetical protein